jgi:hypothetical protein
MPAPGGCPSPARWSLPRGIPLASGDAIVLRSLRAEGAPRAPRARTNPAAVTRVESLPCAGQVGAPGKMTVPGREPFPAFRKVTMMSREKPGLLRRILGPLGGALKRGLLGKSAHGYLKQFADTGEPRGRGSVPSDGDLEQPPRQPDPERSQGAGTAAVHPAASLPGTARRSPELEFEPVHGWTRRQCDGYLGRNPGYRSAYEAALRQARHATVR